MTTGVSFSGNPFGTTSLNSVVFQGGSLYQHIAGANPFGASALGTFLVRQAMLAIPDEMIEAARLEGASEARIVYGLLAPAIAPTLVALFLLSFVSHYNDYFWPLVMTTDEHVRTIPLAIALLREQGTGVRWHVVMAGNVILSAPVILLFVLAQRHLVRAVAQR